MIRHLKRTIALLLVAALFLAAVPVTYAAEDAVEPHPEETQETSTAPPNTESDLTEESVAPSTETTSPSESVGSETAVETEATESETAESTGETEATEESEIDPAHMKGPLEIVSGLWNRMQFCLLCDGWKLPVWKLVNTLLL